MKLYKSMLDKIFATSLTKKELDTLLLLLQAQDDLGTVVNVHWKELATKIGMVSQTFYNCIRALEDKGFIEVHNTDGNGNKNDRGMHTIQILVDSAPYEGSDFVDGIISQEDVIRYIKECGSYLNLNEYSLINAKAFRNLKAEEKKIVLTLLWRHQTTTGLMGRQGIRSYDVILTIEKAAELLGFEWKCGEKGKTLRRKIKRYFEAVCQSGLLPITQDDDHAMRWSLDDMHKQLPQYPMHPKTNETAKDSIADKINRRIINTILAHKKAKASTQDVQDTLKLLDEQYKNFTGKKILASSVQDIVVRCIKDHKTLVPSLINMKCRLLLGLV